MHHFRFHVGDYLAKAAHLSPVKHGVYLLLRCWYIHHEGPIPDKTAIDVGKAPEPVVRAVLEEFFTKRKSGWWHGEIEAAIAEWRLKSKKASESGKLGGRPLQKRLLFDRKAKAKLTTNQEPEESLSVDGKEEAPSTVGEFAEFAPGSTAEQRRERRQKREVCPFERIIALYHETLPSLPKFEVRTAARDGAMRQRWINDLPTAEMWRRFFEYVSRSDFLMGRAPPAPGKRPFRADLEWLTKQGNFAKIKEGKYHG